MTTVRYAREVFDAADEAGARRIILTPEAGQDTDERWARETPYLADLIAAHIPLGPQSLVVDYGCGIGRLAKALIERTGCRVLGVDISARMRALAPEYVASSNFSAISPPMLGALAQNGLRATAALSVWVLQHCLRPDVDVAVLAGALESGAPLFVVNTNVRVVPVDGGRWLNDGLDIRKVLGAHFEFRADGLLDPAVVPPKVSEQTFWATYARR